MSLYAIIETGGKQYKVSHNDIIKIEKIPGEVGELIEFNNVHLLNTGKELVIDEKKLSNASVKGKIIAQEKDKKIIVFKFKRRKNYKRKFGHRQQITRVLIKNIQFGKDLLKPEEEKKKKTKKVVKEPEVETEKSTVETEKAVVETEKAAVEIENKKKEIIETDNEKAETESKTQKTNPDEKIEEKGE